MRNDTVLFSWLKPDLLQTVEGLELIARIVVEGFMTGASKSQTLGIGQTFHQYRSYEQGDDPRLLDWKMFARSEKFFVRLAEVETNLTIKFIVDTSRSMAYEEAGLQKFDLTKIMIAAFAYLAQKQRDAFGVYLINKEKVVSVPPRFEHQQFVRCLHALNNTIPENTWPDNHDIKDLINHQKREMIVFFSDLYDTSTISFIESIKLSLNEVVVFHILGEKELDLAFEGDLTFDDLESGQKVKVSPAAIRTAYVNKVNAWRDEVRGRLLNKGISYQEINMNTDISYLLRTYLQHRRARAV